MNFPNIFVIGYQGKTNHANKQIDKINMLIRKHYPN